MRRGSPSLDVWFYEREVAQAYACLGVASLRHANVQRRDVCAWVRVVLSSVCLRACVVGRALADRAQDACY